MQITVFFWNKRFNVSSPSTKRRKSSLLLCAHLDQQEEFGVSQLRGAGPCQMPMITNIPSAFFSCVMSGPLGMQAIRALNGCKEMVLASLKWPALRKEPRSVMTIPLVNVYIGTLCKNPLHVLSYLANRRVVLNWMQFSRRETSKRAHTHNI
jgi:hypothetical protein